MTLTQKLESARLLIFNSKDAAIAPLLDTMGVDTAYIDKGEALYNETMQLVTNQKKEYQEQSLAYDKFYLKRDEVELTFNRTLKLVKVLSRNDKDLRNRLGLESDTAHAIEAWIDSAVDFYNSLLNEADFLSTIAKFKVTADRLNTEKAAIENLRQLRNEATIEKGQAQEATRLRNEKLDELDDYCKELKTIAELALEGQPQSLEKLGILVRS